MTYNSWLAWTTALVAVAGVGSTAHAEFQKIIDPANTTFTQALGINGSDTIVGYGETGATPNFDGFVLTLPSTFTRENFPNPPPPGATFFTQVVGIDAAGDTVGFYVTNPTVGTTSGFYKPAGGSFTTVNQPGSVFNQLLGINQNGNEIAGYSSFTDPSGMMGQEAFSLIRSTSTYTNINTLLVSQIGPNFNSQATGVNNAGDVVGFYQPTSTTSDGFEDIGGIIHFITAPFAGVVSTMALGINDLGEIVGDYTLADGNTFGFLDNGGVFTTLDPFGSAAVTANGINDNGKIVGFYTNAVTGNTIGFLYPAPEPASLVLLGSGLIGLAVTRRRWRGST